MRIAVARQTRKKEVDDDNTEDEDCWNEKETKLIGFRENRENSW